MLTAMDAWCPGVNAIDTGQLAISPTRHFTGLNRLCEANNAP